MSVTESNDVLLRQIVADLFEIDANDVSDETSQDTVERWDSLGMVNLVSELEAAYNVDFDLTEIAEFRNIGRVKEALRKKGVSFDRP